MNFKEYYLEIKNLIKDDFNANASPSWIAGLFKSLHKYETDKKIFSVMGNDVEPEKMRGFNIKDTVIKYSIKKGLLKKERNRLVVSQKGNSFLRYLNENINALKSINDLSNKELKKEFLKGVEQADKEWFLSLDDAEKEVVEKYNEIDLIDYVFLKGLLKSKQNKKNYKARVISFKEKHEDHFDLLKHLGFFDENDNITDELDKFFTVLGGMDYSHLKNFNRSISSKSDRSAASNALVRNELKRRMDSRSSSSSEFTLRAKEYIENASNDEIKDIRMIKKGKPVNNPDLILNNITDDSGELTTFGKFVSTLIDSNFKDENETDVLNSRISGFDNGRLKRRNEIAKGRKSSFRNFLEK